MQKMLLAALLVAVPSLVLAAGEPAKSGAILNGQPIVLNHPVILPTGGPVGKLDQEISNLIRDIRQDSMDIQQDNANIKRDRQILRNATVTYENAMKAAKMAEFTMIKAHAALARDIEARNSEVRNIREDQAALQQAERRLADPRLFLSGLDKDFHGPAKETGAVIAARRKLEADSAALRRDIERYGNSIKGNFTLAQARALEAQIGREEAAVRADKEALAKLLTSNIVNVNPKPANPPASTTVAPVKKK